MTNFFNKILIWKPEIHGDERGSFHESYNQADFDELIGCVDVIQFDA